MKRAKSVLNVLPMACLLAIAGCSLAPQYQQPEAPMASMWPQQDADAVQGNEQSRRLAADSGWREFFRDPALQQMIETALTNNRDLRVAMLNVDAYRALHRIQRSERFPSVTAVGGSTRQRLPGELSTTGESAISSQYSGTLGFSAWELDMFGRLRSLNEQSLQQYLATEEAQFGTRIALVASVANAWLTLQADQQLLALTADTLKAYQQSYALTERSFAIGVSDALTLSQAQTQVQSAKAILAQYTRLVAQDHNALALLLGVQTVGSTDVSPLTGQLLTPLPVGLPADMLQRRPDIRQAEHLLKAANANIGAARAAFFPSISLTAEAGSASSDLSGLFGSNSGVWLFQPRITLPIFTAGSLRASLDYAEVRKNIQVAGYEKAIQTAFREVADGLAARRTYQQQLTAQNALVDSSQDYYRLAERRFRTGVDSYLTLLDAQRQLFSARQQLITDRLDQLSSEVNLYKALGGGEVALAR